jgi:peptidoglycan/xylan/chitin deacetylase (PgdA/CDA1 family)
MPPQRTVLPSTGEIMKNTAHGLDNLAVSALSVALAVLIILAGVPAGARAAVIERFEPTGKQVALTFDACPTRPPGRFDEAILSVLLRENVPSTIFVSGVFAENNRARMKELAATGLVEFENHSWSHPHLTGVDEARVRDEVLRADALIGEVTGVAPRFFRFPYGEYDAGSPALVERLGRRVVHWTMASGDPDPKIAAAALARGVIDGTRPGAIHIFHVNGRGWKTAEALPAVIDALRKKGYSFVLLQDALPEPDRGILPSDARPARP